VYLACIFTMYANLYAFFEPLGSVIGFITVHLFLDISKSKVAADTLPPRGTWIGIYDPPPV